MRHALAPAVALSLLVALAPIGRARATDARDTREPRQDKGSTAAVVARGKEALQAGNLDAADAAFRKASSGMAIPARLNGELTIAKANAVAGAGDTQAAYQLTTEAFASAPTEQVRRAAERFGAAAHRSAFEVAADLRERLQRGADLAPDFALPTCSDGRTVSLSELRGKVVLLNFWFPT
jgi:hypothetical protein